MRSGKDWAELFRFAAVGLSGVAVNMVTMIVLTLLGPDPEGAVLAIPASEFHVRWYHVFSFGAFLVANLWNFQLNRSWTFRSAGGWWREYRAFLTVGVLAQVLGLGLLTLLMHAHSPIALPRTIFDDSSFLLTRVYWAQLIMIGVVTPVSFLLNKFWTFRRPRRWSGADPARCGPPRK